MERGAFMAGEQQLWGALVKGLTKKIEVPKFAGPPGSAPTARAPTAPAAPARRSPPGRGRSGRRSSDAAAETGTYGAGTGTYAAASMAQGGDDRPSTPDEAVRAIAEHLGDVPRYTVDEYLDRHGGADGPVAARLTAMGLVPEGTGGGRDFWWQAIQAHGVPVLVLGEILRSAPGIPQTSVDRGPLFDFLLESEVAGYRAVKEAGQVSLRTATRIVDVLVEEGAITEDAGVDILSRFYGINALPEGGNWDPDLTMASTITPELSGAFQLLPLVDAQHTGGLTLLVVSHPGPMVLEAVAQMTGRDVALFITSPSRFEEARADWTTRAAKARTARDRKGRGRGRRKKKDAGFRLDQDPFAGMTSPPEVARLLLERATGINATDIHLEPQSDGLRIRFRLDGILHEVSRLRSGLGEEVLSRVKVMADMDITERRKSQDGHIHLELNGDPYDFRIGTVPTSRGERMAIRITPGSKEVPTLDMLGLDEADEEMMRDFTHRSHGIVLACGPVGSGKTTTLYASIGEIDSSQKNIMTIEDPVEIELPDVSQVPVNYKLGVDFGRGLRSLLRQDPNIILVGEVRDEETAKVAIRASLTGLLVYSTIHANSAPGAVTTLYNFNIPPFLLASTVVGVVAQRLMRTICPACRAPFEPDPALVQQAGLPAPGSPIGGEEEEGEKKKTKGKKKKVPVVEYWHGRGCDACYGTGYSGRAGIFEILNATQAMRLAISERAPESEIRRMAVEGGMRTLADAGRAKVLEGVTTVEEFIRVLYQ